MMLPQPHFETPAGVRMYVKPPRLENGIKGAGNGSGSRRTDSVTYVVEREGSLIIPGLSIDWYDTGKTSRQQARLSTIALTVKAAPATTNAIIPDTPAQPQSSRVPSLRTIVLAGIILSAAALATWLCWIALPRLFKWMDARRKMLERSEPARFRQLYLALNSDDPSAAYAALGTWTTSAGYKSIAAWAAATQDQEILKSLEAFEADLYRSDTVVNSKITMNELASAIFSWRDGNGRRLDVKHEKPALPPLNP